MKENKTKPSSLNLDDYLKNVEDGTKRNDSLKLAEIMGEITNSKPVLWGKDIIGFGDIHYKSASGREGDWFLCGFSPRKQYISLYIFGYVENFSNHLENLGKFKTGKGCIYIKKIDDINTDVLKALLNKAIEKTIETYKK